MKAILLETVFGLLILFGGVMVIILGIPMMAAVLGR